ncbi:MAG: hypothetical protein RL748_3381, partial [Pseudomonadota bacterium]
LERNKQLDFMAKNFVDGNLKVQ